MPLQFTYAGGNELIYDSHRALMGPKGERAISTMLSLSLYGNYYYYQAANYSATYLGLTGFSTFLFGMMLLNAALMRVATALEITLLPTKDMVKFVLMSGNVL